MLLSNKGKELRAAIAAKTSGTFLKFYNMTPTKTPQFEQIFFKNLAHNAKKFHWRLTDFKIGLELEFFGSRNPAESHDHGEEPQAPEL